jgi:hypothetical protein
MSIYMQDKPMQFTSDKIKNTQKRWSDEVVNAERILIVGVRPNPDDKHIWDSLSRTSAKIGFIGGRKEFRRWKNHFRKNNKSNFIGGRWLENFDKSIEFLK